VRVCMRVRGRIKTSLSPLYIPEEANPELQVIIAPVGEAFLCVHQVSRSLGERCVEVRCVCVRACVCVCV